MDQYQDWEDDYSQDQDNQNALERYEDDDIVVVEAYDDQQLAEMNEMFDKRFNRARDTVEKAVDTWRYCQEVKLQIARIDSLTSIQMQKTAESFRTFRFILDKVFSERRGSLNQFYKTLDYAMANNDRDLILMSLHQISSVVTSNPLDQFVNFVKIMNDPKQTLELDF